MIHVVRLLIGVVLIAVLTELTVSTNGVFILALVAAFLAYVVGGVVLLALGLDTDAALRRRLRRRKRLDG